MKYAREMKVGALSLVCLFVLFFGFHYLKGVNIFSSVNKYHGVFTHVPGLTEQCPVYIRGYKVGQVDKITYDFSRDSAFTIEVSVDKHISLPVGTRMALVSDGLLGGNAISLELPAGASSSMCESGSFLPTEVVPGLVESLQNGLLADLTATIQHVDEVVEQLSSQVDNDHLKNVLSNADAMTADLKVASHDLKHLMNQQVPSVVAHVDSVLVNVDGLTASLRDADIVGKVDSAVAGINGIVEDVRSPEGTVGKLLYDSSLYTNVNATIVSADSLLTDLKANPKRYVHFSLFGAKDKKK